MKLHRRTEGERRAYVQGYTAALDLAITAADDEHVRDWMTGIRQGVQATVGADDIDESPRREGGTAEGEPTVEEWSALKSCVREHGVGRILPHDKASVLASEAFRKLSAASDLRTAGRNGCVGCGTDGSGLVRGSCPVHDEESCWHCGDKLLPRPLPRCEKCPQECDETDCSEPGCERDPRKSA